MVTIAIFGMWILAIGAMFLILATVHLGLRTIAITSMRTLRDRTHVARLVFSAGPIERGPAP